MEARDALVDAAFAVLVEHGPDFPTAEAARRAGVSKALLFHHYGTREALLDAMAARVLGETQDGLARLVDEHADPRARLHALARTLLEDPTGTSPAEARRVLQFWLADAPHLAEGCRAGLRDALVADFVAATLREGATLGALRTGVDARAVAHAMLARWHGVTALYAAGASVDFEREREALVDELARRTDA